MAEEKPEKETKVENQGMIIPEEMYMTAGAHIGTRQKNSRY